MPDQSSPAVMWFRRDLRLGDKPALHAACATADGGGVLPLFVVDPSLWGPSGPGRRGCLAASLHLKWGEINPRTMLADLTSQPSQGAATYRTELAWREFYADVLWRRPETARGYLRPEFQTMEYDEPGDRFKAWADGRTGYPIVERRRHPVCSRAREGPGGAAERLACSDRRTRRRAPRGAGPTGTHEEKA